MASLFITLDKNGNHKSTVASGLDYFYLVSVNDGILSDSAIFTYGATPPVNLFEGIATCFNILEAFNGNNTNIPEWLSFSVNTDLNAIETKKKSVVADTGSGFREVVSSRYIRTTTIRALPLPVNGEYRSCSITLKTGCYIGTINLNNGFSQTGYSPNDYLNITILLEPYTSLEQIQFSNPYYKLKRDNITVEDFKEVNGVARIDINVIANGVEYYANKLALGIRCYDYNQSNPMWLESSILINSENFRIQGLPNWISYTVEQDENEEFYDHTRRYLLSLTYSVNASPNSREAVFTVEHNDGYESHYVKYEIHIHLDGLEESYETPTETSYISFKPTLLMLPSVASTSAFNVEFNFLNVLDINVLSNLFWCAPIIASTSESSGIIEILWEDNIESTERVATLSLTALSTIDNSTLTSTITIILYTNDSVLDTPEEIIPTTSFIVMDTNIGENYDNTGLLFKDNNANIYSTLEAKDNTLFLGNYLNVNFSLLIKERINDLSSLVISDRTTSVKIANKNSSTYPYTPDMTLSSLDKKIFKKGETYSLGLVFIKSNGVKSSVFYIGDYSPTSEPLISESDNGYSLVKPKALVSIPLSIYNSLKDIGVIGIIPVYALRGNHKIICLGFLNPTISSNERSNSENLTAQYNWFLRFSNTGRAKGENENSHSGDFPEFQSRDDDDTWTFNKSIITMNTPEVEAIDSLTDAELAGCEITPLWKSGTLSFTNSVQLSVNGKYLHSRTRIPSLGYVKDRRETCIDLWHGYIDKGTIKETDSGFIADTKTDDGDHYKTFFVYPWLRNTVGGEGPDSVINSKKYFTSIYIGSTLPFTSSIGTVNKASIYRDTYPALLKFNNDIYQGNIDYIVNISKPYKAFISDAYSIDGLSYSYPKAHPEIGVYAGYNEKGEITDPIYMRYRVAPHLAIKINSMPDISDGIICAELSHSDSSYVFENDPLVLSSLSWIKCGNIVKMSSNNPTLVEFVEGDYFYGRFDSLRTFPYALEDVNSVTDIVSGMLCSKINLDSRCDRNRGIGTALVTSENFNIFNPVYNLDNNYFTYLYINLTDNIYNRKYSNSIQWSMTKTYGNEIDDWCNILEINTLDLDGNKGQLRALLRLSNNIIAFQDSGIAQILYNESMQIAATNGVPIEIANSGKVNGKRYLYENIGCLSEKAMTVSPTGIYFADNINKSIFRLSPNGELADLCLRGGMKSWGLSNIQNSCKCWYDLYSKEVIFTDYSYGLVYSDTFDRFQCFASYENVDKVFSLNGRTYIMYYSDIVSMVGGSNGTIRRYYTLWGKNFLDKSSFFGKVKNVELEIVANPEPTLDKTFTNIEYRADVFNNNQYQPWKTFDKLRVWNEYLDTGNVSLVNLYGKPSNLKKKFRTWYINIPRNSITTDRRKTLDRIRNPWCNIKLSSNMINIDKLVLHDIQVLYLSL